MELITPISYYGGKLKLIDKLLQMIPGHTQYVEPFCGGASLFWAKKKSRNEVINDYDFRVYNFWSVLKTDYYTLERLIKHTLHHEQEYLKAREILNKPCEDKVQYAWAFWVQTQLTFSHIIFGGFAFSKEREQGKTTRFKRECFSDHLYHRIKDAEVFNRNAIDLIKTKDDDDTFMYLDPPYPEGDCGHYKDKKDIYYDLLDLLPTLKSKWLMSSYPSEQLTELRKSMGLNYEDLQQNLSVSGKHNTGKTKVECLTWNYNLNGQALKLFN